MFVSFHTAGGFQKSKWELQDKSECSGDLQDTVLPELPTATDPTSSFPMALPTVPRTSDRAWAAWPFSAQPKAG